MFLNRFVVLQWLFRKPFGIHSPFLYDFASHCLYARNDLPETGFLEKQRKALRRDPAELEVVDYGRGTGRNQDRMGEEPLLYRRRVSSIARRSLQSPALCRLLFRTVQYCAPTTILELGTSLGITTACLAKAAPSARIITLEGCPQTASRAQKLFADNAIPNIEVRTGPFRETLPQTLADLRTVDLVYLDGDHAYEAVMDNFIRISEHIPHNGVFILDDIRWSKGMKKAWLEVAAHPKVTLAVDLFRLGMVFFNPALSKQIIPLGY